ncbi:MAG: apolipoprotein N-acyltransferase [Victivallaceae bacterium]|nr:apolipoprotein N-acyltransferase [Victivallaceae bacterium]
MQAAEKQEKTRSGNEAWRLRRITGIAEFMILFLSGMLMTASVPPLNWSAAAWVALLPLFLICFGRSWRKAALSGFFWGLGWAFTGFYWLREIDPVIPYLMTPVLALFVSAWACLVPGITRGLLIPNALQLQGYSAVKKFIPESALKTFFYAVVLAAWWCIIEWFRSRLLPWNYVSAGQWRNLPLIQICSVTGTYGISFLIVLTNITLALAFRNSFTAAKNRTKFPQAYPFFLTLFLILAVIVSGAYRCREKKKPSNQVSFNAGLIQGNISQRRQATIEQAVEALEVYLKMSYEAARLNPAPDIIIWPETATPFAYNDRSWLGRGYRNGLGNFIKSAKVPVLLGTVDYETLPPYSKRIPGMTNSAFLFASDGSLQDTYSKVQRVPFGEYVPFRKYLPEWVIKRIDMHRDLVSGARFSPLRILPGVRAGISICYEDVFEYISRREALENANLLLVITNDAWYPTSSEPEQHLANSVFRAVETGLPMLRCGNNSASCLVEPDGYISDCLFKKGFIAAPEIRGRRAGIINVKAPFKPKLTFYVRYGNVFLGFCWFVFLAGLTASVLNWRRRKKTLLAKWENTDRHGRTRTDTDGEGR